MIFHAELAALGPEVGLAEEHGGTGGGDDGGIQVARFRRHADEVDDAVDLLAGAGDAAEIEEVVASVDAPVIVDVEANLETDLGREGELIVLMPADVAGQREQTAAAELRRLAGDE